MLKRLLKLTISMLFYIMNLMVSKIIFLLTKKTLSTFVAITYHSVSQKQISQFSKQMDMMLKTGKPIRLERSLSIGKGRHSFAVTFDDGYQSVIQNALPILINKKIPATIFVASGTLGEKPPWVKNINHPFAKETVLTEQQLKELPKDIITIGSHTDTHCKLLNIDKATFKREIVNSKNKLELLSGSEIKLISVPYGQFDKKFTKLFREAGYQMVFLNIPTFPATKTDLFVMGRIGVDTSDWPLEFYLKLIGAYQWLPCAVNLKKTLTGIF